MNCSGNETCFTQMISFADLSGENPQVEIATEEASADKGDFEIVVVRPNPAVDFTRVEFKAYTTNTVRLEVVDLSGRVVAVLCDGNITRGEMYSSILDTKQLENGLYTVRLYSLTHAENSKLVISK